MLKLPVVEGEWAFEGGYHYYPGIEQVKQWIADAGFTLLIETTGDGYEHFVMRKISIVYPGYWRNDPSGR